ncbi:hypothetical protein [Candidatus Thiodictyon syntrophicum]|jgi:hypothetical protein|uniref:hypothetical protein n=1 Tax=Candidatus Thiodictyon syntrophicum TaxID=1166950 RepID=UPI0012FDB3FB|nr:hypothetical protein [Candidatus Thiodictyon syntrophicum]
MSRSEPASQGPHRPAASRCALLALGIASALAPGFADAVPFVLNWGINPITFVDSNVAYNTLAVNCDNAGGSGCTMPGANNTAQVLYSWGEAIIGANRNSRTTWTNNSGSSFVLDHIYIESAGAPVGTGYNDSNPKSKTTGQGAAPVWEWTSDSLGTLLAESQMRITLADSGGNIKWRKDVALFSDFSTQGPSWYSGGGQTTLPTPFGVTLKTSDLINPGDTIQFRLFETVWNGATQNLPDLVFAPITLTIAPAADPVPAPATLALLVLGLPLIGLRRRSMRSER